MTDPSKLPRGGLPPRFFPISSLAVRDPRARIVVLVLLLVLVAGGMVFLTQYAKSPTARQTAEAPTIEVAPEEFSGVPALDMSIAERITDHGPDSRRRWPAEAITYLLLEAANTPAVYSYENSLFPLTPEIAKGIDKDSLPWRFKFVRFRGEVEGRIEESEYEGAEDAPMRVWRGRVRVADGESLRVVFITARAPEYIDTNEPGPAVTELIEDGWVRGRGILVQNYIDERGGDVPALLVVATKVERDFESIPVRSLEDVPFEIIQDSPALAAQEGGRAVLSKEYPRPLYRLVKYAEGMSAAEGAARRAELKLAPARVGNPDAWEALVGKPRDSRGKYFGGLGVVAMSPHRFVAETITPNDAGVEECLNGWILTDERSLFQFLAPGTLGELPKGARVRWEGFFYKTKLYAAQNGTERLAPVFVLTVLEEIKAPESGSLFPVLLAGSVVLAMGLLAWFVLKEDRTKENYRRIRQKRIAANRAVE